MKNLLFKILLIASVLIPSGSLMAQATPGNAGTNPGNSNGGSGIETQPMINPNSMVKPKQDLHAYTGPSGYTGSGGTTGMTGPTGTTCPTTKSILVKPNPNCPEQ